MVAMLACARAMAQSTFDVSGTVVEKATGEAVVAATIQLLTLSDSTFVEGTTTGEQGQFGFKDVKKGDYTLKVSYIGFETKYVNVNLQNQKKVEIGYITMSADAIALEGVEVKVHATKVAVSGDSLVYNAAAYRVPEGSTLEALVKQLPGAKVDKDGTIKINGKEVSKILVDGKEFFLNDKEVAMKNIPTDMIDKMKTYRIVCDGQIVGGVVIRIDHKTLRGDLDLLFVSPHVHSKGIGYAAWCEVEKIHPEVRVWETMTPYFEKRNVHFYVNRCGFHIVEFFGERHPDPNFPSDSPDEMFRFEKVMV